MITEHEFQRVAAYVKEKAGINLNEKRFWFREGLTVICSGRDIIHMMSLWIVWRDFRQDPRQRI